MKPIKAFTMMKHRWKQSRGICEGEYIMCENCDHDPAVAVYPIRYHKKWTPENLIGVCEECKSDFDHSRKMPVGHALWAEEAAKDSILFHTNKR